MPKNPLVFGLLQLLLSVIGLTGAATTLYIDCSATVDGSGSSMTDPMASLHSLSERLNIYTGALTLQPGDQVLIRKGTTCYDSLISTNDGTISEQTVFGSYAKETSDVNKPMISGMRTCTWTSESTNIWKGLCDDPQNYLLSGVTDDVSHWTATSATLLIDQDSGNNYLKVIPQQDTEVSFQLALNSVASISSTELYDITFRCKASSAAGVSFTLDGTAFTPGVNWGSLSLATQYFFTFLLFFLFESLYYEPHLFTY